MSARKYRVKKSQGKKNILKKVERIENTANLIAVKPELPNPPHDKAAVLLVTGDVKRYYTAHLTGDELATINMRASEVIMDQCYYDNAEYTEKIANDLDDPTLPTSVGFVMYAEKKKRSPKLITTRDGNEPGEQIVEYPKLEGSAAYISEVAEVIAGKAPVYIKWESCSITFMVLKGLKTDTKYLVRLAGIFATGIGPFSAPISFRTAEAEEEE